MLHSITVGKVCESISFASSTFVYHLVLSILTFRYKLWIPSKQQLGYIICVGVCSKTRYFSKADLKGEWNIGPALYDIDSVCLLKQPFFLSKGGQNGSILQNNQLEEILQKNPNVVEWIKYQKLLYPSGLKKIEMIVDHLPVISLKFPFAHLVAFSIKKTENYFSFHIPRLIKYGESVEKPKFFVCRYDFEPREDGKICQCAWKNEQDKKIKKDEKKEEIMEEITPQS